MNKGISIAIIDNGINELLIKRGVEKSITIDEHGICIDDAKNIDQQQFQHGTNCAMILEKYCIDFTNHICINIKQIYVFI